LWEFVAKAKKLNIWSRDDYISPKEWRKRRRRQLSIS
jgi:endonuclease YncB( thermonuclease family)